MSFLCLTLAIRLRLCVCLQPFEAFIVLLFKLCWRCTGIYHRTKTAASLWEKFSHYCWQTVNSILQPAKCLQFQATSIGLPLLSSLNSGIYVRNVFLTPEFMCTKLNIDLKATKLLFPPCTFSSITSTYFLCKRSILTCE